MRRAFGYAGAWLMATSVAVMVSWFGCAVVLRDSSPPAPEVLSSMHGRNAAGLPAPVPGTTLIARRTAGGDAPGAPVPTRSTEPRASRGSRPAPPPVTVPTTTRHARPPVHTTPPTQPAGPPTATPTLAAAPDPNATERTFDLTGGRATLSFTPAGVQVIGVNPAPGYDWYVDQSRPGELWVIFGSAGQESDLYAAWNGGPAASVTEYWW
jgi:hypothetical protein